MSNEILEANDTTWSAILDNHAHVVVMFYSPTCSHCREMDPYFVEYAKEFGGDVAFVRLNVARNLKTAALYGVMATPTFKLLCNGRPVQELVGALYPTILKQAISDLRRYGSNCIKKSTSFDAHITGYA